MIGQILGNYLISKGKIDADTLAKVFAKQKETRVKLGLIAVAEKMMTNEQADEVNKLQAVMDKRFGDIAVEKGFLTDEQVGRLLSLQGNPYLSFVQALTDCGCMTLEEVESTISDYQKENNFTATDIESLKSGDVDRIVPVFLPNGCDEVLTGLTSVAVRTILRLIDNDVCMGKATTATSTNVDYIAMQALDGDKKASLAFTATDTDILKIADTFAKEEFGVVDLDSLDAVAEFTNCINGLFATGIASKINMDMLPPCYKDYPVTVTSDVIYIIPLKILGANIKMLVTVDGIMNV